MAAGGSVFLQGKALKRKLLSHKFHWSNDRDFSAMKASLVSNWYGNRHPLWSCAKYLNTFLCGKRTTLSLTGLCNLTLVQSSNRVEGVRRYASQSQRQSPTFLYDVLGVTPRATQAQIKTAYFKLSKTYHPDINKSDTASGKFSQIAEAYSVLGNVRSRRLYDRGIYNPNRPHSSYAAEDFDDHAEPSFGQQEGFQEKSRRPPTGRSPVYNFDEFYRAHYGEAQKRYEKERQRYYEELRQLEEDRRKKAAHMYVMVLLTLLAISLYLTRTEDDPRSSRLRVERREEQRSKSQN